jgi:hypothetical protein
VYKRDVYKNVLHRAGWALSAPFSYIHDIFFNKIRRRLPFTPRKISGTHFSWTLSPEWGPLSLVSITEELLRLHRMEK